MLGDLGTDRAIRTTIELVYCSERTTWIYGFYLTIHRQCLGNVNPLTSAPRSL